MPAAVVVVVAAALVMFVPFAAERVSDGVHELRGHLAAVRILAWLVCALLTGVVVTRHVKIRSQIDEGSVLAVAFDTLPITLLAAWVVTAGAVITAHWLLAVVAGALVVYHLVLVVPRTIATRRPRWTKHAPTFDVVMANVFIDNKTPDDAARQLIEAASDVVLIVESTSGFMKIFDDLGGRDAYPHRVDDPSDDSDYAVTLATRCELGERSGMVTLGPLRLAVAEIDVGGVAALVVGLNPMATVDPGGHETWKEQIDALASFLPTLIGPLLIVGDLNTTRFRPEFQQLLDMGLSDAIDSLGKGLKPSFKLAAEGALSAVPVARLDHALVNDGMRAMQIEDLDPCGSDHLPFRMRLAVRGVPATRQAPDR